jgi:hypothetical protein
VAALLLVCAAWLWTTRLRWVAISPDGLRWLHGLRARHRRWEQYAGIRRGTIEITVWGDELKAGKYADVEFRKGSPLRVSTHTVHGYEDLIDEIQLTSAAAVREWSPTGGSSFGSHFGSGFGSRVGLSDPGPPAHGPLRVHPDGLEWDGTRHPWEEIRDYEVDVGYLRIQPAAGTEFLRRLTELGDWQPVLSLLETNVVRPATPVEAVATAESERSPAPATAL